MRKKKELVRADTSFPIHAHAEQLQIWRGHGGLGVGLGAREGVRAWAQARIIKKSDSSQGGILTREKGRLTSLATSADMALQHSS